MAKKIFDMGKNMDLQSKRRIILGMDMGMGEDIVRAQEYVGGEIIRFVKIPPDIMLKEGSIEPEGEHRCSQCGRQVFRTNEGLLRKLCGACHRERVGKKPAGM